MKNYVTALAGITAIACLAAMPAQAIFPNPEVLPEFVIGPCNTYLHPESNPECYAPFWMSLDTLAKYPHDMKTVLQGMTFDGQVTAFTEVSRFKINLAWTQNGDHRPIAVTCVSTGRRICFMGFMKLYHGEREGS